MELVPILSTIILVGTIATFILAVCAYILYKIREHRSRQRAESQPAVEPRRQPMMAPPMLAPALPGAISQPAPVSMYIAPTTALPPQGPFVEVDEIREAPVPAGGWSQPPQLEQALAASPSYTRPRNGDGHGAPAPRLAPPQYEPIPAQYEPIPEPSRPARTPAAMPMSSAPAEPHQSSMFWEYTDEGFVPVDPRQNAAREEQHRQEERRRAEETRRRREEDDNDAASAWL